MRIEEDMYRGEKIYVDIEAEEQRYGERRRNRNTKKREREDRKRGREESRTWKRVVEKEE